MRGEDLAPWRSEATPTDEAMERGVKEPEPERALKLACRSAATDLGIA